MSDLRCALKHLLPGLSPSPSRAVFFWSIPAFLSQEAQRTVHLSPQTAVQCTQMLCGSLADLNKVQPDRSGQAFCSSCFFTAAGEIIFCFLFGPLLLQNAPRLFKQYFSDPAG